MATGQHVGRVGARETFIQLRLVFRQGFEGEYGTVYLHKFQDPQGNVLIWWTSKEVGEIDDLLSGKGTVKEHNEYEGVKQTVLTRCKLAVETPLPLFSQEAT